MTTSPFTAVAMESGRAFASPALTATMTMSARPAAKSFSDGTLIFLGRGRRSAFRLRRATKTSETLSDLAAALATASPIFPAPRAATIEPAGPG